MPEDTLSSSVKHLLEIIFVFSAFSCTSLNVIALENKEKQTHESGSVAGRIVAYNLYRFLLSWHHFKHDIIIIY